MGKVVFNDVEYKDGMKVKLLGCEKALEAQNENGRLAVDFGFISPEEIDSKYVYTLKAE